MATIKVLPVSKSLIEQIDLRDPLFLPVEAIIASTTYGIAVVADEKVIGAIGLSVAWPGVGQVWGLVGKDFPKFKLACTKIIRQFLNTVIRQFGLRWLLGYVEATRGSALVYATLFGFKVRTLFVRFGPNQENFWLVAKEVT